MRYIETLVIVSATVVCAVMQVTSQEVPRPRLIDREAHLKEIAAQLDPINRMRIAIESGDRGDGVYYLWMDGMKGLGVKQAAFTVRFIWTKRTRSVEIVDVKYLTRYYVMNLEIKDPDLNRQIVDSGLEAKLSAEALTRAAKMIPQYLTPSWNGPVCGDLDINLLDDETLPILNVIPLIESDCRVPRVGKGR